jgi:hypothetical protein
MDVTKPLKFIRFGDICVTKLYECIRFGAMHVTKPNQFIRLGDIYVTKLYKMYKIWNHG